MNKQDLLKQIVVNPKVMVGKPTIRGLRITDSHILSALANKVSIADVLEDYPELEFDDIRAVLIYAGNLVNEEQVFVAGQNF